MSPSDQAKPKAAGLLQKPWDSQRLSDLCLQMAQNLAHKPFIEDCPARLEWQGAEPRQLTFEQFCRRAQFFAAQLRTMGIQPGERVMLLLPNCVEFPIALFGCYFARSVPVIAGIDENVETLRIAAERAQVACIITTDFVEGLDIGAKARQVAAKTLRVRFVGGFGAHLADGIASLEGWSEEDVMPGPAAPARPQSAEALISFGPHADGLRAYIRSEAQIFAELLALSTVLPLARGQSLIATSNPGAPASLIAGPLLALFSGAQLRLLGPYRSGRLRPLLRDGKAAIVVGPAHFAQKLAADLSRTGQDFAIAGILALLAGDALASGAEANDPRILAWFMDLDGQALLAAKTPPKAGLAGLVGTHAHPLPDLLPEEAPHITLMLGADGSLLVEGFGAANIVQRGRIAGAGEAA